MKVFTLGLSLVYAASFTSSSNTDGFTNYKGNLEHLSAIINLFGSVSEGFNRNASCLDDLISKDLILSVLSSFKDLNLDYHKLGVWLGDLNPSRFDFICTALDSSGINVTELVRGYPNEVSEWKLASMNFPNFKSLADELLKSMAPDLCDNFADNPSKLLTRGRLDYCLAHWLKVGEHEKIRKVLAKHGWFKVTKIDATKAYEGHETEYVELHCKLVEDRTLYWTLVLQLPDFLTATHLQALFQLARSKKWPYGLTIRSNRQDEELQKLILDLNRMIGERDPVFENIIYDSEAFMGKWALPKCLDRWTRPRYEIISNLNRNYPMRLAQAFEATWNFDRNEDILRNTLNFLSHLHVDPEIYIQQQYYAWLVVPRTFSYGILCIARLVKPFLKSLPAEWPLLWHLKPLYEAMKNNPSDYLPNELIESGTKWVIERLKQVSLSEDEVLVGIERKTINHDTSLDILAFHESSWVRLRKKCLHLSEITEFLLRFTRTSTLFFKAFHQASSEASHTTSMKIIDSCAPSIAISANYQFLDVVRMSLTPNEILRSITNVKIRNRIALMLHLNPNVKSYCGKTLVKKNSQFFRAWVMLHLPAHDHDVLDLKLLDYYFHNRIFGLYHGFEIVNYAETGESVLLGIYNAPETFTMQRANHEGSWDLTFEPTSPIVEEVSRKRDRDDDYNSPNKRQKTNQE